MRDNDGSVDRRQLLGGGALAVLGAMGKQGRGLGQFGEAHFIAVSAKNEIFVADTLNWRVQKYVKKQ